MSGLARQHGLPIIIVIIIIITVGAIQWLCNSGASGWLPGSQGLSGPEAKLRPWRAAIGLCPAPCVVCRRAVIEGRLRVPVAPNTAPGAVSSKGRYRPRCAGNCGIGVLYKHWHPCRQASGAKVVKVWCLRRRWHFGSSFCTTRCFYVGLTAFCASASLLFPVFASRGSWCQG